VDNDGTRIQILDSFLEDAHRINFHVQYTIRQEFICDIKNFWFHFPPHSNFLHCGISPFCLQKLSQHQEAELYLFDDVAAQATHVGMQDISHHNHRSQKTVQPDPTAFLEIIATFQARTHIHFGATSPIFLDADEIYHVCLDGHVMATLMPFALIKQIGLSMSCGLSHALLVLTFNQPFIWIN